MLNRPYGEQGWQERQLRWLGLLRRLRSEGRPRPCGPTESCVPVATAGAGTGPWQVKKRRAGVSARSQWEMATTLSLPSARQPGKMMADGARGWAARRCSGAVRNFVNEANHEERHS